MDLRSIRIRRKPRGRAAIALALLAGLAGGETSAAPAAKAPRDSVEAGLRADTSLAAKFKAAVFYHDLARANPDGRDRKRSQTLFGEILGTHPGSAEALAYLGSLSTLEGRDAHLPWNKIRYVKKGCALMDQAVAEDSTNAMVRLIRFQNNFQLPDFFNRRPFVAADLAYLRRAEVLTGLSPRNRGQVLFYSGKLDEKTNRVPEARGFYRQAMDSGDPEFRAQAEAALRRIEK
jgi:tetratricopeptide (TPR) repeat protein